MPATPGSRLGGYEVIAALGAGGMGEVYRAHDVKLGRDVALKILPASFTTDPERVARFRREAQVLASLNHPHVGAIYGLDDADGTQFLVLELVEGESLDKRIARGPIPVDEALAIARQTAEALEAAHEKGIVHRDLKPANIALTRDGSVKVLDFGLAKATEPTGASLDVTNSPTITTPAMMSGVGMILGTAAYMSPEQAKGRPADKRSDVWAFGCVLFEMLTGRRAFEGEDVAETLAFVLTRQPDFGALPAMTPVAIRRLVRRCLEKDRKRRLADAADARLEIDEAAATTSTDPFTPIAPAAQRPHIWRLVLAIIGAALVGSAITMAVVGRSMRSSPATAIPVRFVISLPERQTFASGRPTVAMSPDGTTVAIAENDQLYLRPLSESENHPIPGSQIDDAQSVREVTTPAFSPDGRFLAFAAGQTIKKIPVGGGTAVTVCDAGGPIFGMSWEGDAIIYGRGNAAVRGSRGGGVMRVSASGGEPQSIVSVSADEVVHGPQLLAGGRAVLFTLATGTADDRWDQAKIVVQDLGSGNRKVVLDGGSDARYVPTGHITYARRGVLYAIRFDVQRLATVGSPLPIVEGVRRASVAGNSGTAHYHFSPNGTLVYVPGSPTLGRALAFVDRKGAVEPLRLPEHQYESPRLSPDGKQLAVATDDGAETVVWIHDLSVDRSLRRLSLGRRSRFPLWSADGTRVVFQSEDGGDAAIFWQRADGAGTPERLTTAEKGEAHIPDSWSPNGDVFLFTRVKESSASLWTFSLRDRKAVPFGNVESSGWPNGVFSPDGRWVAYSHGGRGGVERRGVFVQPFPSTGTVYQIAAGALFPLWSRDAAELLYVLPVQGGAFNTVKVTTRPGFAFGTPSVLARRELITPRGGDRSHRNWDIAADGRLIGVLDGRTQGMPQIQVVLNWFEELQQRLPVK
jgi:eukaryotic-like serine/threonine-protein kinase